MSEAIRVIIVILFILISIFSGVFLAVAVVSIGAHVEQTKVDEPVRYFPDTAGTWGLNCDGRITGVTESGFVYACEGSETDIRPWMLPLLVLGAVVVSVFFISLGSDTGQQDIEANGKRRR